MIKALLPVLCVFISLNCSEYSGSRELHIKQDQSYPRWLKTGIQRTSQTSGIAFLGIDKNYAKSFLLADDMGELHHLKISSDTLFNISPVVFENNVKKFLAPFPKADFEDLAYDRSENKMYLSIEGDGKDYQKFAGIYRLEFKNDNVFADTVINISRVDIKPDQLFYKFVKNNIGYEGIAVDENYVYLGLEGIINEGVFTDSTVIYIVDKKNMNIVKTQNTKPLNIHSISGLFSDANYSVYGIDRNFKDLFHITFDKNFNVRGLAHKKLKSEIPGYHEFNYVAALESITMDNSRNIYLTDDPWKEFFVPSKEILNKLDSTTVQNFKTYVPIIFKYKLEK